MEDNQLKNTVITVFSVIILLFVLSLIPEFRVGSYKIRRVGIFAYLFSKNERKIKNSEDSMQKTYKNTSDCPPAIICLEDYDTNKNGSLAFIQAIAHIQQDTMCRIAFFGDSFVEGDMVLAHLRDTLQSVFGGKQVGFLPITSPVARNRPTITHQYQGWTTKSILDRRQHTKYPYGICGSVFLPKPNASVSFHVNPLVKLATLGNFSSVRLFYHAQTNTAIKISTGKQSQLLTLSRSESPVSVQTFQQNNLQNIQFDFPYSTDSLAVFGISLEGGKGVYLDNFALRGNSGTNLIKIPQKVLQNVDSFQHYSLIVLEYGLNVSGGNEKGLMQYGKEMEKTVEHIKSAFPNSSILIMGVSDRATKNEKGGLSTAPQIEMIVEIQRKIAQKYGLLFWDTYKAMGGKNSMLVWREKGWANADYTHLTFEGGKALARKLANAIFLEISTRSSGGVSTSSMPL